MVPLGDLLLPLLVLVVPLGREALHWVDPHVKHPLKLLLLPLFFKSVRHRAVHELPLPQNHQAGQAEEEEHPRDHRLPLCTALVHLSKALIEADAVQCDLLLIGERGPGALLLLLQGLLLRAQVLHIADLRQRVLPPVKVGRQGIVIYLRDSMSPTYTDRCGNGTSANKTKGSGGQHSVQVPVWLALNLKQRQKCRILPPQWMDVDKLEEVREMERKEDSFTPPPSPYYMELTKLLLNHASDNIPKADEIRTLVKDIWDTRIAKLRLSADSFISQQEAHAKLDNLTLMEINTTRSFLLGSLNCMFKLRSNMQPGTSTGKGPDY